MSRDAVEGLRVLLSAYACEPGKGSEEGLGWNVAEEMARRHQVWVLTRTNNRAIIEDEIARNPEPNLRFVYYDLPRWARWWKRGGRGVQLYYYLWQIGALATARRVTRDVSFDVAHHVTFAKYWTPTFLAFLPIPFVWGPLGGGDAVPWSFWKDLSLRGKLYEAIRAAACWVGEHDPLVRRAAKRARVTVATTRATAERLRRLGVPVVHEFSQVGLSASEIGVLGRSTPRDQDRVRFVSIGRLLAWKGFQWGLRAFAEAEVPDSEYWIIGSGPERRHLERLVGALGMADRVQFLGYLPHHETLQRLGQCDVLVHPSLHESGGGVCLEAMACGIPVICLDLGGLATQVTPKTGVKVSAGSPTQAVRDIAEAMRRLGTNRGLREEMAVAARSRAQLEYSWSRKADRIEAFYAAASKINGPSPGISNPAQSI